MEEPVNSHFVCFSGEMFLDGSSVTVAVKMLKESATRETEEDFLREVEVMSGFRHQHILTLLGVVPRGKRRLIQATVLPRQMACLSTHQISNLVSSVNQLNLV